MAGQRVCVPGKEARVTAVQTQDVTVPSADRGDARASLDTMLVSLINERGSDLHITVGAPPMVRINGSLRPLPEYDKLTRTDTGTLLRAMVDDDHWALFEREQELDIAYSIPGVARFRANLYVQRGSAGAVFRAIPHEIKPLDQLGVPDQVARFAQLPRGLVL